MFIPCVSQERLIKQMGTVSEETIQEFGLALAVVLNKGAIVSIEESAEKPKPQKPGFFSPSLSLTQN
ncbi:MAG: hypothetical protein RLZZ338_478 [Cyanobacteriota bacterium]|jgi:hypothetical protein